MITANPDMDSTAIALVTCMFFNPDIAAEKEIFGDSCASWDRQLTKVTEGMIRYPKGYVPPISEITCTTRLCSNKKTYDWTWTAPDLDLAAFDAYMAQSTSLKEYWNVD